MVAGIIVAGGLGTRAGGNLPKQFQQINKKEIYRFSIDKFVESDKIDTIIFVSHKQWISEVADRYPNIVVCEGGTSRRESVSNGLDRCPSGTDKVLIHDAARPFIDLEIIDKLVAALDYNDASAPYLNLNDSVIHDDGTKLSRIDRDSLKAIQTPQAFKKHIISDIISTNESISDEIGLLINLTGDSGVKLIKGKQIYNKITTKLDFKYAQYYGKLL